VSVVSSVSDVSVVNHMDYVNYLLQRDGSCCVVFALCNALRFFWKSSPRPGTAAWEKLVDLAGCRNGSTVRRYAVAEALGLHLTPIVPVERSIAEAPAMLTVWNPERVGSSLHAVLVVGGTPPDRVLLANYRWRRGPVVEELPWDSIPMPPEGNANRRAWSVRLVSPRSS